MSDDKLMEHLNALVMIEAYNKEYGDTGRLALCPLPDSDERSLMLDEETIIGHLSKDNILAAVTTICDYKKAAAALENKSPYHTINIKTKAGVLKAFTDSSDPENPEAGIILIPEGDTEILDLAYAQVKDSEMLECEDDGACEDDVFLYCFADPFDEGYSNKYIIKREDIKEALGIEE